MRATQRLVKVPQAYSAWCLLWADVRHHLENGVELEVEVRKPKRTLPQNALMWRLLRAVSKQVDWYGERLTEEDWKDIFTASARKQRAVKGIDGGFVVLGARTSEMTTEEMSEVIEIAYAFGATHDVDFAEDEKTTC